jgi:LysM repeat protein
MNRFRTIFEKFWIWLGGGEAPRRETPTALTQPADFSPRRSSSASAPSPEPEPVIISVQAGDTLFTIADQYNVTVQSIIQLNRLASNQIYVGQKLYLPPNATLPLPRPERPKLSAIPRVPPIAASLEPPPSQRVKPDPRLREQGRLDLQFESPPDEKTPPAASTERRAPDRQPSQAPPAAKQGQPTAPSQAPPTRQKAPSQQPAQRTPPPQRAARPKARVSDPTPIHKPPKPRPDVKKQPAPAQKQSGPQTENVIRFPDRPPASPQKPPAAKKEVAPKKPASTERIAQAPASPRQNVVRTPPQVPVTDSGSPVKKLQPAKPSIRHFPAAARQGIFVAYHTLGNQIEREKLARLMQKSCLNTVVLDVKNEKGYLSYRSQSPLAAEIGANRLIVEDMRQLVAWFRANKVQPVARLVVCKDTLLAEAYPTLAAQNAQTGALWRDGQNMAWLDPFQEPVWDYHLQLARELAGMGFEAVLFDSLRFPAPERYGQPQFSQPATPASRVNALCGFLSAARGHLAPFGVKIATSLVGRACRRTDDALVGQQIERLAQYLDIACPLLYPGQWAEATANGANLPDGWYNNVYQGTRQVIERVTRHAPHCQVHPWLQDFSADSANLYPLDAEAVQLQITAAVEGGAKGFLAWNPQTEYTWEAYRLL